MKTLRNANRKERDVLALGSSSSVQPLGGSRGRSRSRPSCGEQGIEEEAAGPEVDVCGVLVRL